MALVCIGSFRGAPGATTLAVAVAMSWPRPVVLVEADPDGGVLAVRHGLSRQPGLAGLAAAVREIPSTEALFRNAQATPAVDVPVVVAPEAAPISAGILDDVAGELGPWCSAVEGADVVVDCGRLSLRSPVLPVLPHAAAVLAVARPRADELHVAAHRRNLLVGGRSGLVLVGEHPYTAREVIDQLGVPVVGLVADDPRAASLLEEGGSGRSVRRSALLRTAGGLVDELAEQLGSGPGAPPPATPGPVA